MHMIYYDERKHLLSKALSIQDAKDLSNIQRLLDAVTKEQDNTINVLVKDQQKFEELNIELQSKLDKANEYKDVLIGKLRKHDLAKLSMQKPELIEKRINKI